MAVRIIFDAEDESIVGERIEDDGWGMVLMRIVCFVLGDADAMRACDANVMYGMYRKLKVGTAFVTWQVAIMFVSG